MTYQLPASFNSILKVMVLAVSLLAASFGQVPQIVGPTGPSAVIPGGADFTLHVYGANFLPNATVNWNGQARTTTYISGHELDAEILATDIATPTAGLISVTNQAPTGPLSSNASASFAQVEVHIPTVSFSSGPPKVYWGIGNANFVADVDGDGNLDLMGNANINSTFRALLNDGNGTFRDGPFTTFDAYLEYSAPPVLAFGDFNGDGQLDIVYDKGQDSPRTQVTYLAVNFGNGDANYTPGPTSARYENPKTFTAEFPGGVVVGDFNRDGILDVALEPWGNNQFSISIDLGNGDGSFRHGGQFRAPVTEYVVAGDFNGDGILDLATFGNTNSGHFALGIMLGNGDGTFGPMKRVATVSTNPAAYYGNLHATDLNEDGNLDLVFSNGTGVGVLLGNGDGTFRSAVFYTTPLQIDSEAISVVVADLNSDGHQDVLIGNGDVAWLLMGAGDGTLALGNMLSFPNGIETAAAADFSADGLVDLVVTIGAPNKEGTGIYLHNY